MFRNWTEWNPNPMNFLWLMNTSIEKFILARVCLTYNMKLIKFLDISTKNITPHSFFYTIKFVHLTKPEGSHWCIFVWCYWKTLSACVTSGTMPTTMSIPFLKKSACEINYIIQCVVFKAMMSTPSVYTLSIHIWHIEY